MAHDDGAMAVRPLANYPHVKRSGDFLFVSGTSARRPDDTVAGAGTDASGETRPDIRVQTERTIENIRQKLESAGASLADLSELTCFLVDMGDYGGFNEVYNGYFDAETGPARTTVAVRQLPRADFLIEIKAMAYKPIAD